MVADKDFVKAGMRVCRDGNKTLNGKDRGMKKDAKQ